jgi:hypothetical protein
MSAGEREQKFKEMKQRQEAAAAKLLYIWPNYFASLEKDDQVQEKDRVFLKEMKSKIKDKNTLPTDLL